MLVRSRAIGSAGERLVHTEEVTGSIPVSPTQVRAGVPVRGRRLRCFLTAPRRDEQQERSAPVTIVATGQRCRRSWTRTCWPSATRWSALAGLARVALAGAD